jgi:hypothetical protein
MKKGEMDGLVARIEQMMNEESTEKNLDLKEKK